MLYKISRIKSFCCAQCFACSSVHLAALSARWDKIREKKCQPYCCFFFRYFLTQKNSEEWRKFSIKNIDFSRPLTQSCNLSYTHYLSNYFSIFSPLWSVVHICRRIIESCNLDRKKASRAMRKSCLGNACEVGTGTMHCSCLHPICRQSSRDISFIHFSNVICIFLATLTS